MKIKKVLGIGITAAMLVAQFSGIKVHADTVTTTSNPTAKINLAKTVEKNQWGLNEEFTINYTIQPQDIPQSLVPPELYHKNGADISLVIDTSGSMAWNLEGNQPGTTTTYIQSNNGQFVRVYRGSISVYGQYYEETIREYTSWWAYNVKTNKYVIIGSGYYSKYYIINSDNKGNNYITYNGTKYYVDLSTRYTSKTTTEQSRLQVVKSAATNFINKFSSYSNVRIGFIEYSSDATKKYDLVNNLGFNQITSYINSESLNADGATNIGDGLRKGYWQLEGNGSNDKKQFIVLLTDGEPTKYSYYSDTNSSDYYDYYYDYYTRYYKHFLYDNRAHYSLDGNGSNDSDGNSLRYANNIASMLSKDNSLKSFMIAFSKDATNNKLAGISAIANNNQPGFYKEATTADDLNEVYEQIAQSILSDLPIFGLRLEETFPQGISIAAMSNGLKRDSNNEQKIIGDIGNINYKLVDGVFKAEPINFWVKLKGTTVGDYTLGRDGAGNSTSFVSYKDIDGKNVTPPPSFPVININIYNNQPPTLNGTLSNNDANTSYNLSVDVDKPSNINIKAQSTSTVPITSQNHANDSVEGSQGSVYNYNLPVDVSVVNGNISSNIYSLCIEAIDKNNLKTVETVPLVTADIVKDTNNSSINNLIIKTESNTIIKEVKLNGTSIISDKVTNNGEYTSSISNLNDGDNTITITIENGYNNKTTMTFHKTFDLKSKRTAYGIFTNSTPSHLVLNDQSQLSVVNGFTNKVGFLIKADNIDSNIKLQFDNRLSIVANNFEVYDANAPITNGTQTLTKLGQIQTVQNPLNFNMHEIVSKDKIESGKYYMLVFDLKVTANDVKSISDINISAKNNIIIDSIPYGISLKLNPKPKVQ